MNDDDPASNLGKLQKQILLWLGEKSGVDSWEKLRQKFPPHKEYIATDSFSSLNNTMASVREMLKNWSINFKDVFKTTPFQIVERERDEPYLRPEYFISNALTKKESVHWSGREFLGHRPSKSESVKLSESLRRLEDRGLIKLHKLEGKGIRVSHVALTPKGMAASVKLKIEMGAE